MQKFNRAPGLNLYVKFLDESVNDERLTKMFARFGKIVSAKVMTDMGLSRGFGFVCFSTPEEAARAIKEMHGRIISSKALYVSYAQTKAERQAYLNSLGSTGDLREKERLFVRSRVFYSSKTEIDLASGETSTESFASRAPIVLTEGPPRPMATYSEVTRRHLPKVVVKEAETANELEDETATEREDEEKADEATNTAVEEVDEEQTEEQSESPVEQAVSANQIDAAAADVTITYASLARFSSSDSSFGVDVGDCLAEGPFVPQTASSISLMQERRRLGQLLFPRVRAICDDIAKQIMDVLLEFDNRRLLYLLENTDGLQVQVEETLAYLFDFRSGELAGDSSDEDF